MRYMWAVGFLIVIGLLAYQVVHAAIVADWSQATFFFLLLWGLFWMLGINGDEREK